MSDLSTNKLKIGLLKDGVWYLTLYDAAWLFSLDGLLIVRLSKKDSFPKPSFKKTENYYSYSDIVEFMEKNVPSVSFSLKAQSFIRGKLDQQSMIMSSNQTSCSSY